MMTGCLTGQAIRRAGGRVARMLLCSALVCAASTHLPLVGVAQDPMSVDTPALGMTGWRTDPVVVKTPALGMTGWRPDGPGLELLSGTLDLRDPSGSACPRRAEAALSLRTSVAGQVPFSLDCTGNRSWSQSAIAHETAPGTYLAVAVLPFEVTHKEPINCALRSRLTAPPKIVAVRGRSYDCAKTGPDRVVTAVPTPTVGPPRVVDPPRPGCVGGRLLVKGTNPVRYGCDCPAGQTALSTGPSSYRCQGRAAAGITCTGGTVRNGQCLCPSIMQKMQAGPNAWRCQGRGARPGPKLRPAIRPR